MKRIAILLAVVLFTNFLSFGQDTSGYKETLKKMMEVSGSQETYKVAINQMVTMFKTQKSEVPEAFWTEFEQEINKNAAEDLLNMLLPVYQKHLTQDDLKGVIAFYESPVGKKFAGETPALMRESMQTGQEWGKKIGEEVMKKLQEKGYK